MSRTIKVLGAMVAGITLVSGALLALDPDPVFRPSMAMSATEDAPLFETAPSRDWKRIVILDSRGVEGGEAQVDAHFQRFFKDCAKTGAGCHFVVRKDGERIELCDRWRQQDASALCGSKGFEAWNSQTIGICLIGNADKRSFDKAQLEDLAWLVKQLQAHYHIPTHISATEDGVQVKMGRKFPKADFMAQLAQ